MELELLKELTRGNTIQVVAAVIQGISILVIAVVSLNLSDKITNTLSGRD